MARYIKNYQTDKSLQEIHAALSRFLQAEGYEYIQYDGENVFKKGKGWLTSPTFFKFSYSNNMVHMETWMKYALLPGVYVGELGTTGFVGAAVKGVWKNRIAYIDRILSTPRYSQSVSGYTNTVQDPQLQYSEELEGTQVLNGEETQILNDGYGDTQVLDNYPENGADKSAEVVFCTNCGTRLPKSSAFCTSCGHPVGQNQYGQKLSGAQSPYTSMTLPAGQFVSKKEFINKYAQPFLRKDLKTIAIICYVCAGATFLVSCFINPLGIIDALLLLGLTLGMHLGRSKVCAILIFVLSCIEVLLSIIALETPPIVWLVTGIGALVTFHKIDKQYRQFLNENN